MICFDEAMVRLVANVFPLDAEVISFADAGGRTLAQDVIAQLPSPRLTMSAMDGYAVILNSMADGDILNVAGEARPGCPHHSPIAAGEAVRIFTGAPIPLGADCVIMQEYATRDGNIVRFTEGFGSSRNLRVKGSDFQAGDVLLPKGTRLNPKSLVAAAAADVSEIVVHKRPRVAVLATGDELAEPGLAKERPYAVPDSISHAIAAQIERAGADVIGRQCAGDDLPTLIDLAGTLLTRADLVVVTGGASVGDHDFAKPMFDRHGLKPIFEKVAIKPGKPVWLGKANDTLVLGLPGNPTSAMVTARLFLDPLLALLQGRRSGHLWHTMVLAGKLPAIGDRETFVRAAWEENGLQPLINQDSGVQGDLARAQWLIRCSAGQASLPSSTVVSALQF